MKLEQRIKNLIIALLIGALVITGGSIHFPAYVAAETDDTVEDTAESENEEAEEETEDSDDEDEEEDEEEEEEDEEEDEEEYLEDGDIVTFSGSDYEILSIDNMTVAYYQPTKAKVKQVAIPKKITAKEDGEKLSFKVVAISEDAFRGYSGLKSITVKSTTIKKVGKNALKGISPKCKIKVPGKMLNKYKRLFANKGQKKTVKVVKG